MTASWEAFAAELGLTGVRLLAREPVPYVDLLGLDDASRRVVVILVTGDTVEWQLGRALGAAADVASWDRDRLIGVHADSSRRRLGSPALVLVAGGYDPRALATIDWLASRHDVPVSAYSVAMIRFGGERLLSVRREPAEPGREPAPDVDFLLSGGNAQPRQHVVEDDGYTEATPPTSA